MDKAKSKPFDISKRSIWNAYKRVKANSGTAGVDDQTMQRFEERLKDNLYKLWNRMSSGSYFPRAVLRVEIPKNDGGKRPLGIPTVEDRIAQMAVKHHLEPMLEPHFHPDSYAYRPGKSALQAVGVTRKRCWKFDWVLDLDIKGCFDNLHHDLIMKSVRHHTDCEWVLLYIERWLKAPVQLRDGSLEQPKKGTPQGGVISPLLMNLYLHYAFDEWMRRTHPDILFERYADDIIAHCSSEDEARGLKGEIEDRLAECGLELHPDKTKIVYCKSSSRDGNAPEVQFDFLGYSFQPRNAKSRRGDFFTAYSPAMSNKAGKEVRTEMNSWAILKLTSLSIEDLSRRFNPTLRGWLNYYGRYRKSGTYATFRHFNRILERWTMKKFKRFRRRKRQARLWLQRIARKHPQLFAHWQKLALLPAG